MYLGQLFNGLFRRDADPGNPILTLVSIIYSTEAKTFSGPAVYVTQDLSDMLNPTPTDTSDDDGSAMSTSDPSFAAASSSIITSTSHRTSSKASITSSKPSPSITVAPTPTQIHTSSATKNSATTSPTPTHAPSSGMSGGAKAGLAFGLIILFALIGFGLFALYRRQKSKNDAHERLDDEKMAMTPPDSLPRFPEPNNTSAAAVPRSEEVPRLSIRPMTEFAPAFGAEQRNATPRAAPPSSMSNLAPAAGVAGAALAAGAIAHKENTGLRKPGVSAWERPGADRNAANDPSNPFGNHAETLSSSPPNASVASIKANDASDIRPQSPAINAADFPLPASIPPSPGQASFRTGPGKGSDGAASAVVGAVAGAAVGAAVAKNSPKKPVAQGPVHRVQMDFMPSMEDELEIHTGQLIRVKHEYDDGWALCEAMDGSKGGVVPRSCLSKNPLQPRPANGPHQGMPGRPGPGPRGPNGPGGVPRPLTPGGGRNSPAPGGRASPGPGMMPRPLTPTGRNSPAPYGHGPRPMSPAGGPGPRRPRANSNASPYQAYQPTARSMSPGPYGAGNLKPTPRPDNQRRRSKSVSEAVNGPALMAQGPMASPVSSGPVVRKPVGGHKPSPSS